MSEVNYWIERAYEAEHDLAAERARTQELEDALALAQAREDRAENQARHWKEQEAKQRRLHHEQGDWKHRALAAELSVGHERARTQELERELALKNHTINWQQGRVDEEIARADAAEQKIQRVRELADEAEEGDALYPAGLLGSRVLRALDADVPATPQATHPFVPARVTFDSGITEEVCGHIYADGPLCGKYSGDPVHGLPVADAPAAEAWPCIADGCGCDPQRMHRPWCQRPDGGSE